MRGGAIQAEIPDVQPSYICGSTKIGDSTNEAALNTALAKYTLIPEPQQGKLADAEGVLPAGNKLYVIYKMNIKGTIVFFSVDKTKKLENGRYAYLTA